MKKMPAFIALLLLVPTERTMADSRYSFCYAENRETETFIVSNVFSWDPALVEGDEWLRNVNDEFSRTTEREVGDTRYDPNCGAQVGLSRERVEQNRADYVDQRSGWRRIDYRI